MDFEQQKYCNKIINKYFNKKLKMTIEDEENYQNPNDCWICNEKIIKDKDKVFAIYQVNIEVLHIVNVT